MVNDFLGYHVYEQIELLHTMLRARGYSHEEAISYLRRHNILKGEMKHPSLTQKRVNVVKREIQKEYKNYN